MEILQALQQLGLPGWFLIIASSVAILHYTGIIKLLGERVADQQEHIQSAEEKREQYRRLQDSWQQDRISTLLEENESFIRERIWEKLTEIEMGVRKLDMTVAQTRDTLGAVYREIYKDSKHQSD